MSAHPLTPAQRDTLAGAARDGETAAETARRRYVTEATIRTQRRQVLRRLEARTIAHAASIAEREGLLT